jgi:prepilin-type N-terminal cleavage/methylation domain-containing protein
MTRRGFSLMELIVVLSLFGLITSGAFLIFKMGSRGFQHAVSKTGAIGDIHRVTRALSRDIQLTHFYSVATHPRLVSTSEGDVSRDGVGLAGLSNWGAASNFEIGTELPKWNRWIVYYATRHEEGRFIRLEVERTKPAGSTSFYPLTPLDGLEGLMSNDPVNVPGALRVTTLCNDVRSFQAEIDNYSRLVRLRLTLHNSPGRRMTSEQRIQESFETKIEIYPMNSYPEL